MEQITNNIDGVKKEKVLKALFAVLVILAVFLAIETLNALKENSYIGQGIVSANVINVSGEGEVFAVPDTATFSFSVVESGKTVAVAQDTAAKKVNGILDAIKAMGVKDKDIKTTGYNSYPKYEYAQAQICSNGYCPPSRQILTGYEVNQTVTVKVRKTADAGAVLTKVGTLGAQNISGLDFVVDNMDAVNAQARDKAIQDAKAKAHILAKSLGVRLSKIVNFQESGSQPPIYYGMAMDTKTIGAPVPTVPQLPTGENKVTSNVTITYEVD